MSEIRFFLQILQFDATMTTLKSIEEIQNFAMYYFGSYPLFRYDVAPVVNGEDTVYTLMVTVYSFTF